VEAGFMVKIVVPIMTTSGKAVDRQDAKEVLEAKVPEPNIVEFEKLLVVALLISETREDVPSDAD
jgi:hypothetical protein